MRTLFQAKCLFNMRVGLESASHTLFGQDLRKIVLARRADADSTQIVPQGGLSRGFEQHALSHAKRSAHASADAPCKGNTARAVLRKSYWGENGFG